VAVDNELLIKKGREAWFKTYFQPSIAATIYRVEKDRFWTNLPRCEGQVLMLQENQSVEVGISHSEGFYSAETRLIGIENTYERFYCFAIPDHFERAQERQFLRASHAATVFFQTVGAEAQTTLINFSAGGVMVFLVPNVQKVIDTGKDITITIGFEEATIKSPVVFSWKKTYDNIPFAGFEFRNIDEATRETIDGMVRKINEDK